jgi:lysozyme
MTTVWLTTDLERDEGFRAEPYVDSTGHWTWGYGHKLSGPLPPGSVIGVVAAYQVLLADIERTKVGLSANPATEWWGQLDDLRQDVIVNMAFNLGVAKLATFGQFLDFVKRGEYAQAADDELHTLWATQVGDRAHRLAQQMRTGEHQ